MASSALSSSAVAVCGSSSTCERLSLSGGGIGSDMGEAAGGAVAGTADGAVAGAAGGTAAGATDGTTAGGAAAGAMGGAVGGATAVAAAGGCMGACGCCDSSGGALTLRLCCSFKISAFLRSSSDTGGIAVVRRASAWIGSRAHGPCARPGCHSTVPFKAPNLRQHNSHFKLPQMSLAALGKCFLRTEGIKSREAAVSQKRTEGERTAA